MAFVRHALEDWTNNLGLDASLDVTRHSRCRRERAHASRVRTAITVEDPLVILRR